MGYEGIENKVALITGGSEGIGFGIAKAFTDEGAKVTITGLSKLRTAKKKARRWNSHNKCRHHPSRALSGYTRSSAKRVREIGYSCK